MRTRSREFFSGKIKKWNDPKITALNPGVSLPDQEIVVVHRSDGSGTTYIWTDYLSKVSAGMETKGRDKYLGKLADWYRRKRE